MKRCDKCLLPEAWPGISLNEQNLCSVCIEQQGEKGVLAHEEWERNRNASLADLERLLQSCRGRGPYDLLVLLSGGKDSTYLLWYLKEHYQLKPLAFTCDNGFLSSVAKKNLERTVREMGVDHMWGRPPASLVTRLFRLLLCQASARFQPAVGTVCPSCFGLTLLMGLKAAAQKQIPLLAVGLSPVQGRFSSLYQTPPAKVRGIIERSQRDPESLFGMRLTVEEAADLEVPCANLEQIPAIIFPFLALDYRIGDIRRTVIEKGFIAPGHEHPLLSNCLVNLLMIEYDLLRFRYCSYEGEFGHLLRTDELDRKEYRALYDRVSEEIDQGIFMKAEIDSVLARIGLAKHDPPFYNLVPLSPGR
jgi:hypothetical protein